MNNTYTRSHIDAMIHKFLGMSGIPHLYSDDAGSAMDVINYVHENTNYSFQMVKLDKELWKESWRVSLVGGDPDDVFTMVAPNLSMGICLLTIEVYEKVWKHGLKE